MNSYCYNAILDRVVDGDTVDLRVDLGFGVWTHQRFRLEGIDAPERFTASGKLATQFLIELLTDKKLSVQSGKTGKYGRWIGVISVEGQDVSKAIVDAGLAEWKDYG